ncbi:MAG: DEAD/DEAH box helicase [Candidatus Aenigmarchaeota archaeon]|nr:DEAD/DEAH box helicase [Candidatus Aenigmarchaeota archaeon]
MQYKNFTLDDFQVKAIESIEQNHSVVVSAATGTGKTLIADYIINKFIDEGKRVIYTAPIKALSNQKFRDFRKEYGEDRVGIITGDVQINTESQILVMTTEIYRNMLLTKDALITTVKYVVFDEIHYISDWERGTIWEESIIFSPPHMRFLCLSATIPNADEFARWISTIKSHNVDVVMNEIRAVPLQHMLYDIDLGFTEAKELKKILQIPEYDDVFARKKKKRREHYPVPDHTRIISELKNKGWLPCFYFIFSRALCEKKAKELSQRNNFITGDQRIRLADIFKKTITPELARMPSVQRLKSFAMKGIGVHHAGLLPQFKEAIELAFTENLLPVLYTTETFAVGINMPAKSVVFNSLYKFDGMNFRYLNSKEYFQLAGRAGRRGIDKIGYAIGVADRNNIDINKIIEFTARDVEPIHSQFKLSYNTALHLLHYHVPEEAETILQSNFDYFVRKNQNVHVRIMAQYKNKLKILENMGYIKNNKLTERGEFLLHVYSNELLIGEIFSTHLHKELNENETILTVGAIVHEERKNVSFKIKGAAEIERRLLQKILRNRYVYEKINKMHVRRLSLIISRWAGGANFTEVAGLTTLQEGDIIHVFRRIIDSLRQIRHATKDETLKDKLTTCIALIDRDVVKVEF